MDLFETLQETLAHLEEEDDPQLSVLDSTSSGNLSKLRQAVQEWREGRRSAYLQATREVLVQLDLAARQLWQIESDPVLTPLLDSVAYLLDELYDAVQQMRDSLEIGEAERALSEFHRLLERVDRVEQEVRRAA